MPEHEDLDLHMDDLFPRSPPSSRGPYATAGERLARLEEAVSHLTEAVRAHTQRLTGTSETVRSLSERVRSLEEQTKHQVITIAELKPLAEQYRRWQERKKQIKNWINWLIAAFTVYATLISNKGNLLDVLHALERMLGAG